MHHRLTVIFIALLSLSAAIHAADPTATAYTWNECQGSYRPYPAPQNITILPDSLTPVMINHVGRHGARYPSSAKKSGFLRKALVRINEEGGGLSAEGKQLLNIVDKVVEASSGRWGSLSALGMAEQRGIASRMFKAYRPLFDTGRVNAISSYSPRCIMSMYEFAHQLSRLDNNIDISTLSGRTNSPLMRFFDNNAAFDEFLDSDDLAATLQRFTTADVPLAPLYRLASHDIKNLFDENEAREVVSSEFAVLTGLEAMGMSCTPATFFTPAEQNSLWAASNMTHYLRRTASTLSTVPADIAAPLLEEIIKTFDTYISTPEAIAPVQLRFGHAETLMPLLSLMRMKGCYYLTNYFDTVGMHWCDFHVTPMAANLQLVLLRSKKGRLYLKAELNETAVPLIPGKADIYVPWDSAREYLMRCLPFDYNVD